MAVTGIHHINFLVSNIDDGIRQYERILGAGVFIRDELPGRGVITARASLGQQWLVLVQPVDTDSVPGRHLAEHGEGFFLMSLTVDNLATAVTTMHEQGVAFDEGGERKGLLDWHVCDIDSTTTFGAQLQLCEERPE